MKILKSLIVAGVIAASGSSAFAISISGEISMSGGATANNTDLTAATAISSFGVVTVTPGSTAGAYAGTDGSLVTYTPFTFTPFSGPISPLWTFTSGGVTYSFDLLSVSKDPGATANSLTLHGSGMARISGGVYEDTPGEWVFTINRGTSLFSFSSSTAVPDGGATAMLVGLGLLGMGCMRRKLS
jgi:hypothetical protein